MRRTILSIIAISLLSSLWSVTVVAEEAAARATEKNYQVVPYLSGGIGDEERDELLAREKNYNLKLAFAEKTGSYMADVAVVILDAKGQTVLDANSSGPFFLATLPAGNYRIKVTANGQTQQAKVLISKKGHQARNFFW